MRKQVILCLKVAWTVAALLTLFFGTRVCSTAGDACGAAGDAMLVLMVLLTVPIGIVFLPVSLAVVSSISGYSPSDYVFGWIVMALGGYLQWFVIVPRLLEKTPYTSLNLNATLPLAEAQSPSFTDSQLLSIAPRQDTIPEPRVPGKIRARQARKHVRSFDKLGRTPLERVITQ